MPVGAVVRDDVDDDANVQCSGLVDQLLRSGERPEHRVDVAVVGDVVPAVGHRRGVPRREPDRVDPEVAQVRKLRSHSGEIANAVSVAVREAAHVDLVDDGATPPRTPFVSVEAWSALGAGIGPR